MKSNEKCDFSRAQLAQSPSITIIKFNSKRFIVNLLFLVTFMIHQRENCAERVAGSSSSRLADSNSFSIYFNRKKAAQRVLSG